MESKNTGSRDMKDLTARKRKLRNEMEQIQGGIRSSLRDVRHNVADRTRLRSLVDKYPLYLVGSALVTGFLIANKTGGHSRGNRLEERQPAIRKPSANRFFSLLGDEFKKMITQRAAQYVTRRVEEAIDRHIEKKE